MRERPPVIKISPKAAEKIKSLLQGRDKPSEGIRVYVKSGGCSGFSYRIEFVDKIDPRDEIVEFDGVRVYIEPSAILFLVGSEMDYTEEMFKSGFSFSNPNEKSRCGCGESFSI